MKMKFDLESYENGRRFVSNAAQEFLFLQLNIVYLVEHVVRVSNSRNKDANLCAQNCPYARIQRYRQQNPSNIEGDFVLKIHAFKITCYMLRCSIPFEGNRKQLHLNARASQHSDGREKKKEKCVWFENHITRTSKTKSLSKLYSNQKRNVHRIPNSNWNASTVKWLLLSSFPFCLMQRLFFAEISSSFAPKIQTNQRKKNCTIFGIWIISPP